MKDKKASENTIEYWLEVFGTKKYPKHTKKGGKWLLFIEKEEVDRKWEIIKEAIRNNLLGEMAKVSTAKTRKENKHVICVYTYSSEDKEDMEKIRGELRNLGFKEKIPYKRDIETIKGIYGTKEEFYTWN